MTTNLNPVHFPFIRSYLRQIRKFPDKITRSYLLNLLHKRCKRPYGNDPKRVQSRILKSIHFLETIRLKVAAANSGHLLMFEDLLKESFARKGERREKFINPYVIPSVQQIPKGLSYSETRFPIYPPIVMKLITSSQSNQLRTVPSQVDLQSISPTSIITTVWSDLPTEFQPDLTHLGKSNGMGIMCSSRQINHRNKLKKKWIDGLIGAPLGVIEDEKIRKVETFEEVSKRILDEFGTDLSVEILQESSKMLQELIAQSSIKGNSGTPRYAFSSNLSLSSNPNKLNPIRLIPNENRIPNKLPSSHPFSPTPLNHSHDPIESLLPKRSRLQPKEDTINLKNGPRRLTHRFIRRRYQSVLNLVPLITVPDDYQKSQVKVKGKLTGKEKKGKGEIKGIDRSWITPGSANGRKVCVKRAGVGLGSGRVGICGMDHEDSIWL
ncbi:uncharacterized protein MELLADRAFT_65554 [Melampsora larici-populina 98AG31]|uniref:LYR motif-containing protein Cup1-like N-terminal domain-containing protein n=1 Tax=Melampsora larici-populina (strain 98AG31 / pathotype 3-4-7) TaxID=747676 RepID=F4RVV5_MELLP|nr:uncharacterized protein MELLADRAFT_65554 [Melampsora larici-populina 98AG31]EGG03516.1 hypothetical protein MELLADRAFT_65554 [Melampsora larici-populina 98AG31]